MENKEISGKDRDLTPSELLVEGTQQENLKEEELKIAVKEAQDSAELDVDPRSPGFGGVDFGMDDRIKKMENALKGAKDAFRLSGNKLFEQILFLAVICFIVVLIGLVIAFELYTTEFDETWTWQIIYYTAIRITIFGAFLSLAGYCFKMLSSHVHLYKKNRQKQAIIESMASLVHTGSVGSQDKIHENLTEIITQADTIGIIKKESDFKPSFSIEQLEKFFPKKEK